MSMAGYYNQGATDFWIDAKDTESAAKALKEMAREEDYFIYDDGIIDMLWYFGFDTIVNTEGDVNYIFLKDGYVPIDPYKLFKTIAPYVKSGSYVCMDDDGETFFKYVFEYGKVKKQYGHIVYEDEKEE